METINSNGKRQKILKVLLPVLAVGLMAAAYFSIRAFQNEWTDDASISGDVTEVSAKVPGQIIRVEARANQEVREGDLLAVIDPRDYQARYDEAEASLQNALSAQKQAESNVKLTVAGSQAGALQVSAARSQFKEAKAQLSAAEADATLADTDLTRYRKLYARDEVSRQQLDRAVADTQRANANLKAARNRETTALFNFRETRTRLLHSHNINVVKEQLQSSNAQFQVTRAQVKQAEAALRGAKLNLSYTQIRAPVSGRVTNKTVEPGNYVQPGQVMLSIVPRQVWVQANFKETQLTRIRAGQSVGIKVDAYPGKIFRGHVDSIQAGTGSAFSLLPPENATGNYVKVVQRVPVKIVFDDPMDPRYALTPGMSVVPEIKVR